MEDLRSIICDLRSLMVLMTNEDRLELIRTIMEGYCGHCGSEYLPCYCWNDE